MKFEGKERADSYEVQLAYFSGAGGAFDITVVFFPGTASKQSSIVMGQ